jgi:hypothetical protein
MDVAALALGLLSLQTGNTQQQIATSVLKSNLDSEKSSVLAILGAGTSSLANVGPGIGGNLNISA